MVCAAEIDARVKKNENEQVFTRCRTRRSQTGVAEENKIHPVEIVIDEELRGRVEATRKRTNVLLED